LIFAKADLNVLTAAAEKEGMRTLRKVAIEKWRSGITSSEEVIAVTSEG
jgi:type II secretory ATPase GspE/PulE/Tfp pilus assembly ATPase PilB-like protein